MVIAGVVMVGFLLMVGFAILLGRGMAELGREPPRAPGKDVGPVILPDELTVADVEYFADQREAL